MQKGEFVSSLWHYPLDDDNEEREYMYEQHETHVGNTVDVNKSISSHPSFPTRQQHENSFSERSLRARHNHISTTTTTNSAHSICTSILSSSFLEGIKDRSTSVGSTCSRDDDDDECGGGYWNTARERESSEARITAAPCAAPSPLPRPAPRGGARTVREGGNTTITTGIGQQGRGQPLLWDSPRRTSQQIQPDEITAVDRQQVSLIESERGNYPLRSRATDYTSSYSGGGGGYAFSVGQYRSPTASPAGHAQDDEVGVGGVGWRPTVCTASRTTLDEEREEKHVGVGMGVRGGSSRSSRSPSVVQEISISLSASRARSESMQQEQHKDEEWEASSSQQQLYYYYCRVARGVESSNSRPRDDDRGGANVSPLPYSTAHMPNMEDATAHSTTTVVGSHSSLPPPPPPPVRDVRTDPYISFILQKASQLERQALMREARAEAEGDFRVLPEEQQQPSINTPLHLVVDSKESNYLSTEGSTNRGPICGARPTARQIALYTEALKSCVVALETLEAAKAHVAAVDTDSNNSNNSNKVFAADEEAVAGRGSSNTSTSSALRLIISKTRDIVEHCEALKGLILASSTSSASFCGGRGGEYDAREEEEEKTTDIELILKYQHDLKRVQGKLMAKENLNATLPQHEPTLMHGTATRRRGDTLYSPSTSSTAATPARKSVPSMRASRSLRDYRPQQQQQQANGTMAAGGEEDGNYYYHTYFHDVDGASLSCQKAVVEGELERQRRERQQRLAAVKEKRDASDPANFTPTFAQFTAGGARGAFFLPPCIAAHGMHAPPHPLRGKRPASNRGDGGNPSFFTLYDLSSARERMLMAGLLQNKRADKGGGEEKGHSFGLGWHPHSLDCPSTLFADSTTSWCTCEHMYRSTNNPSSSARNTSEGIETNPSIAPTIAKPSNIDTPTDELWFAGAGGMVSPADDDRQFRYRPRAHPQQKKSNSYDVPSSQNKSSCLSNDSDESRYEPVSQVDGEDCQYDSACMPSPAARSSVEDRFSRALASYGAQAEEIGKHEVGNEECASKETPAEKASFKHGGVAPKNSDYLLRIKHRLEMERVAREGLSNNKGNRSQTKSAARSSSSNSRPKRMAKSPPSRSSSAFSSASSASAVNRRANSHLREHVVPSSSTNAGVHVKKARDEAKSENPSCVRQQRDVRSATPSHLTSARARSVSGTIAPSKVSSLVTTPREDNKVISSSMKNEDTEGMTNNNKFMMYTRSNASKQGEEVNGRAARGSPWGGELHERETSSADGGPKRQQHQQLVSGGSRLPHNANMNKTLRLTTATHHLGEVQHGDTKSSFVRGGHLRDEPQEFIGGQGKRGLLRMKDDNDVYSALGTPNTSGHQSSAPSDESRRGHYDKRPAKKSSSREGPKTTLGTWAPSKVNSFL